jgi:hypothetical protein
MIFLSLVKSDKTVKIKNKTYGYINKIIYSLDTFRVIGMIKNPKKFVYVSRCEIDVIERCEKLGISMKGYRYINRLESVCKSFIGKEITIDACFSGKSIPITNINIVGNMLEDIFYPFFKESCPDFREGPKQSSPDYYAGDFQFELKAFYKTPGFDISNFTSFIHQVSEPDGLIKKLFKTKYLVFEYDIKNDAFIIKNFWLLNIWDLPSYGKTNPISVQSKKNIWYNIRPGPKTTWVKGDKSATLFIENLIKCIETCPNDLDNKDYLISCILKQKEEAKIQGFL